jgi:hypothetical protein
MKTNLSIDISTDTLGALALAAHQSDRTLNAFVESILEDFVQLVPTPHSGQREFTFEEKGDKVTEEAVEEVVEKPEGKAKDLTRPPFNKHGEKPVSLKPKKTTNTWVDPEKKNTTNSWLF